MPQTAEVENPRAVIGDNEAPDYAQQVAASLTRDYAEISKTVEELLAEARAAPAVVNDEAQLGVCSRIVKRLRDTAARAEAFRVKEKEPYLRGGNAVDQFFGALMMRCERQKKNDKAGAADVLQARVHDYNERKLAAERAVREEEERIAANVLRKAEEDRRAEEKRLREEEQKRLDAAAAAEAAKRPASVAKLEEKAATQTQAVAFQSGKVESARAIEDAARANLSDARAANAAKPADMVRTRSDDGVLNTMAKEPYAEIVDAAKLDKETLWPFIKEEHLAMALRSWAKVTAHRKEMKGASIGHRNKTVIR